MVGRAWNEATIACSRPENLHVHVHMQQWWVWCASGTMTSGKLCLHIMVHILILSINFLLLVILVRFMWNLYRPGNEAACRSVPLSNRSKELNHSSISLCKCRPQFLMLKPQGTHGFFLPAFCCSLGWPGESLGLRTAPLTILSVCGYGVDSHAIFLTAHTQCRWSVWSPAVSSRWRRFSETLGHKEASYQSTVQRWANLFFINSWLPIFRLACAYNRASPIRIMHYWAQHGYFLISCDNW